MALAIIEDPHLLAESAKRGDDPGATAERMLARWLRLLARELERLDLTEQQCLPLWQAVGATRLARERGEPFATFAAAVASEREPVYGRGEGATAATVHLAVIAAMPAARVPRVVEVR